MTRNAQLIKQRGTGRVKTWVKLTKPGRQALAGHLAELQRLAELAAVR